MAHEPSYINYVLLTVQGTRILSHGRACVNLSQLCDWAEISFRAGSPGSLFLKPIFTFHSLHGRECQKAAVLRREHS